MALASPSPAAFEFVRLVARAYAGLVQTHLMDPETGLGGKLFYAGELDDEGRALVVAANIAGAASLVAAADRAAQKQAIRDGVADFLVNSLDEALRIIKNQLRKREAAAICVSLAPAAVEREMQERGVLPDLLRRDVPLAPYHDALLPQEGKHKSIETPALVMWSVDSDHARWLPRLDAIALDCLNRDAWPARRWLRLAPRFLGRLALGLRLLDCDREFAARFVEQLRIRADRGDLAFAFEVRSYLRGLEEKYSFALREP